MGKQRQTDPQLACTAQLAHKSEVINALFSRVFVISVLLKTIKTAQTLTDVIVPAHITHPCLGGL